MADIELKYLTDLASASSAEGDDLFHINQSGGDRSITLDVLVNAIFNARFPVGKVEWFANNTNPNAIWAGSTWARVPGAGKTIRLANSTGGDVIQQGGNDAVTIGLTNLPQHRHSIDFDTADFDLGEPATSSGGSHVHQFNYKRNGKTSDGSTDGSADVMKTSSGPVQESRSTASGGSHSHKIPLGTHKHRVKGDTGNEGDGEQISIVNAYVKLAAWYRTA